MNAKIEALLNSLDSKFSSYEKEYEVTRFLNATRPTYNILDFYTDNVCNCIFEDFIKKFKEEITKKVEEFEKEFASAISDLELNFDERFDDPFSKQDEHFNLSAGAFGGFAIGSIIGEALIPFIGIGAGIMAIYNSSKKKSALNSQIRRTAREINTKIKDTIRNQINKVYKISELKNVTVNIIKSKETKKQTNPKRPSKFDLTTDDYKDISYNDSSNTNVIFSPTKEQKPKISQVIVDTPAKPNVTKAKPKILNSYNNKPIKPVISKTTVENKEKCQIINNDVERYSPERSINFVPSSQKWHPNTFYYNNPLMSQEYIVTDNGVHAGNKHSVDYFDDNNLSLRDKEIKDNY